MSLEWVYQELLGDLRSCLQAARQGDERAYHASWELRERLLEIGCDPACPELEAAAELAQSQARVRKS